MNGWGLFLVAAGGVFVGYLLRAVECKAQRARQVSLTEPYPWRVDEPPRNWWIDDDTEGLTVD